MTTEKKAGAWQEQPATTTTDIKVSPVAVDVNNLLGATR